MQDLLLKSIPPYNNAYLTRYRKKIQKLHIKTGGKSTAHSINAFNTTSLVLQELQ